MNRSKKSFYPKIIFILGIIFLTGCYSKRNCSKIKSLCKCEYSGVLSDLDGQYLNSPDSKSFLLRDIYTKRITKKMVHDSLVLQLKFHEKKFEIKGLVNDSVIFVKHQKGKWKDNQFSVRTDFDIFGIPPLFFYAGKSKTYIGMDTDSTLKINRGFNEIGMLLLFAAGNDGRYCRSYQKKSD